MLGLAQGWRVAAETAGEWLCLRVVPGGPDAQTDPHGAEAIWSLAREHGKVRFVVELDGALPLTSLLIGQIVMLHKRAHLSGGTLRLCGLSADQERTLRLMGLAERLPNYASQAAALAGDRPNKPR